MQDNETWDVSSGPGVTALGLAAARAVETGTGDRLIEDRFAAGLFAAADTGLPMRVRWPAPGEPVSAQEALHLHGSRYIGLRSRFYDDFLLAAAEDGIAQAVLLGAGLDTRAYRLTWPTGFRVYEVDQPGVLAFKRSVLAKEHARPACEGIAVGIDLRDAWAQALLRNGFDPETPAVWVAEGLLAYLPAAAEAELLGDVQRLSAAGSRLALDRIAGSPAGGDRLRRLSERSGIDMEGLISEEARTDVGGRMAELGWSVGEQSTEDLARRYGRDLRDPFLDGSRPDPDAGEEPPWLNTWFLSARR